MLGAITAWTSGCIGPGLSGEMSREEAVRLYNGGIAEEKWLEELDTISRNLPMPDTKSVQLSDGFLFYKTSLCNGESWVVDVIPPVDAPEVLKNLARSLRKDAPEPVKFVLDGNTLTRDGVPVSEAELRDFAKRTAALPEAQRPRADILAKATVYASDLSKVMKILKEEALVSCDVRFETPEEAK